MEESIRRFVLVSVKIFACLFRCGDWSFAWLRKWNLDELLKRFTIIFESVSIMVRGVET